MTKPIDTDHSKSSNPSASDSNTAVDREPSPDPKIAVSDDEIDLSSTILLHDDPFSNETSKRLFDAIDELRKCGAGEVLDLPQVRDSGSDC